jgi:hypothetical protein
MNDESLTPVGAQYIDRETLVHIRQALGLALRLSQSVFEAHGPRGDGILTRSECDELESLRLRARAALLNLNER